MEDNRALFQWPEQAKFGRVIPKARLVPAGKGAAAKRSQLAQVVDNIRWQYKLAAATTNLPAQPPITEIQVLYIQLKAGQVQAFNHKLLRGIDQSIPFPVVFEIQQAEADGGHIQTIAAHKKPNPKAKGKWIIDRYHSSGWQAASQPRNALPTATNLLQLYNQLLSQLIAVPAQSGETAEQQSQRQAQADSLGKQIERLNAKLNAEKQFNRKIALNQQLRQLKQQHAALVQPTETAQ